MSEIVAPEAHGKLTDRQNRLVEALLSGKSDQEAFEAAGYVSAASAALAMRSPQVQAALMTARMAKLTGNLALKAIEAIETLITSEKTPAATKLAASKYVLEQAGHTAAGGEDGDVPLHEMTPEQLSRFIAKAQTVIDAGGEPPVIAVVPDDGALKRASAPRPRRKASESD